MRPLVQNINQDLTYLSFLMDLVDDILKGAATPSNTEETNKFAAIFRMDRDSDQLYCFKKCYERAQEMKFLVRFLTRKGLKEIDPYRHMSELKEELEKLGKLKKNGPQFRWKHYKLEKNIYAVREFFDDLSGFVDNLRVFQNLTDPGHECALFMNKKSAYLHALLRRLEFLDMSLKDLLDHLQPNEIIV